MWRVRRQIQQVKTSLPPILKSFFYFLSGMDSSTIHYKESRFINTKGKSFELLNNKVRINALCSSCPITLITTVNDSKAVQTRPFRAGNENLLCRKLPAIRYISFWANMAFISIEKIYDPFSRKLFQLFKALYFVSIQLRARL